MAKIDELVKQLTPYQEREFITIPLKEGWRYWRRKRHREQINHSYFHKTIPIEGDTILEYNESSTISICEVRRILLSEIEILEVK